MYISDPINIDRKNGCMDVMVFCSEAAAELFVDGLSQGRRKADDLGVIIWRKVPLADRTKLSL